MRSVGNCLPGQVPERLLCKYKGVQPARKWHGHVKLRSTHTRAHDENTSARDYGEQLVAGIEQASAVEARETLAQVGL